MAKEGTVAPRERVNITYQPATGTAKEQVELPLKFLLLADLTGQVDPRPVEERAPISVDKDNFGRVMAEQGLTVRAMVPNRLSDEAGDELAVSLQIRGLADLTPDGIAHQVPELQQLLELRSALIALKGPLGNLPSFRRKIQGLLADDQARKRLASELGRDQG
jgi:type VI secretion system protein ImpB